MSTAAPATELSQSQPEYYVWAFPGAPVRIHFKLSTVARIREYLLTGLDSDPLKCTEAGGLLLGTTSPGRVEISGFQSFEHPAKSRFFVLCDAGKSLLRKAIEEHRQSAGSVSVVGYFRSQIRDGLGLCHEDLELIADLFPDPSNVFLLVRPDENGTPLAGFFFRDGDAIFADASFMPFPLDERLLAIVRPARRLIEIPAQSVEPVNRQASKQPLQADSKRRYLLSIGLTAAAIAISMGAYFFRASLFQKNSAAAPPGAVSSPLTVFSPISLSASRSDTNVVITWDSQSPVISNARVGILTIRDGDSRKDLSLTNAQLQMRKVVYTPETDRIEAALEVFSVDGKSTSDSVLFILNLPAQPDIADSPEPVDRSRFRSAVPDEVETLSPTTEITAKEVRAFTAPPVVPQRAPVQEVVTNMPPPVEIGSVSTPQADIPLPNSVVIKPIDIQMPALPQERQDVPAAKTNTMQPPQPLRQVKPVLPPNVGVLLTRPVDVRVRVRINENGKVIHAQPIVPAGTLNSYLGSAAVAAARLWTFQAARQGNTNVASDFVLQFRFDPAK